MKITTKILIPLFFLIGLINHCIGQIHLGIKAGLNLSNQIHEGFALKVETKIIPTYMLGGIVEFELSNNFRIQSGLQLQVKGVEGTTPIRFKTSLNYIYIPVKLDYHLKKLIIGVGPYGALAIGGKNEENSQDEDLELGEQIDDLYSPIDYGLIFEGGYKLGKFKVSANYDLGLANINPQEIKEAYPSVNIRNVVLGLGFTYFFN